MSPRRPGREIDALLGEFLEECAPWAGSTEDLSAYAMRPVAFAEEVLGLRLLRWQREWLATFHDSRQHVIWSANGTGKSLLAQVILTYVPAVLGGIAVYCSATERQTKAQLVAGLRRLVRGATRLRAAVYQHGCVFPSGGAVHFINAGELDALQGFHAEWQVVWADEAQALDDDGKLSALQGNSIAERNYVVLTGNPISLSGPFPRVAQGKDLSWRRTRVSAFDVLDDPAADVLQRSGAGLVSRAGVDALRQTWGEESAIFQARVHARFPAQASDAFFPPDAVERAIALYRERTQWPQPRHFRLVAGVDVGASEEGDESVLVFARRGFVEAIVSWRLGDTMATVRRIEEELRRRGVLRRPLSKQPAREHALLQMAVGQALILGKPAGDPLSIGAHPCIVRVDELGVGKGVADRLRELGYSSEPFNASKRPTNDDLALSYANRRAEAYGRFRTMLVNGEVAIPDDALLVEELRTCRSTLTGTGRVLILAKDEWRRMIGRSPDRLDAVVMACAGSGVLDFATGLDAPVAF